MAKATEILSRLKSAGSITAYGRTLWADGETANIDSIRKRTKRYLKRMNVKIPPAMQKAGRKFIKPKGE